MSQFRTLLTGIGLFVYSATQAQYFAGTIALRSYFGPIVSAVNGGGGAVRAISSDPMWNETFKIWDFSNQALSNGDEVALEATNGKFLSPRFDIPGVPLLAIGGGAWAWERLRIYKTNGTGRIITGDEIYFIAANGKTISARFDQTGIPLTANTGWVGTWEKFRAQLSPSDFKLSFCSKGTRVFSRFSGPSAEYVLMVDLTRATMESLSGKVNRDSTTLTKRSISDYWNTALSRPNTPVFLVNGTYFMSDFGLNTTLSFGLREASGKYVKGQLDWPNSRGLCFKGSEVVIHSNLKDALNGYAYHTVIGGLSRETSASDNEMRGRNLVGICDSFGEGRKQMIQFYISNSALKSRGFQVLESFGSTEFMQLDGGASTTLMYQGSNFIVSGRRSLPNVLTFYSPNN